jgi:hypothetical protein
MARSILSNPNINGPQHFQGVLEAIDFERLAQLKIPLYARAILYCSDSGGIVKSYREHFEGVVSEEAGHLILPRPQLFTRGQIGDQTAELSNKYPLGLLENPNAPKDYEFRIDGEPSNNYESIALFSSWVLPALARKKALNHNPNHTSQAWFYLSPNKDKPYDNSMLLISGCLEVLADSVGETRVFTVKDLDKLAKLKVSPR